MKKSAVAQAIDVLAAERGRLEAEAYRLKLSRDVCASAIPSAMDHVGDALPYSMPRFINEDAPTDHGVPVPYARKMYPGGRLRTQPRSGRSVTTKKKRPYTLTAAGRAKRKAGMRKYWAKRRKAKAGAP